ncbi:hypothetical protein LTR91_024573 [Friedmanniomyces endolithicus]|uniref:Uncharacterized protein n=1 Tax=Friedmanniomyces endolithicus TaxID=329885 RepID=A0AAN6H1C8_9PEZI|nr:hypothetical protein LTR57_024739 [Friedmanniomyces endolithicus]KAK0952144.1 hypothetical protein LTR91_024573 [Friedmanniomyces endolithicus]KAK0952781.1 hypothetical protein LTS01_024681 [Friedmanniomyces endolithicus]KAK1022252.1 hypothetical protein LTS16_025867 [Friedmanniomyces endolithicus]
MQLSMWIWNAALLLADQGQIDLLVTEARDLNITDLYVYVAPTWLQEKTVDIANLNIAIQSGGIHAWALDGDADYIDVDAAETRLPPAPASIAIKADIEPQDTPQHDGRFFNGIAELDLNTEQLLSRDTLLSKWVDRLSWASQLVRSHDMQFGAALPFWLNDYEGEPLDIPTSTAGGHTGVMNLLMPILDEYVVMSYNTDPPSTASRVLQQAMYASQQASAGQEMPRVLGGVEVGHGVGTGVEGCRVGRY